VEEESFELSGSWVVPPQNSCWNFLFSYGGIVIYGNKIIGMILDFFVINLVRLTIDLL
jgi:hypothetical protein